MARKSFAKAKAEAQEHLEQALAIADKFPKSNFTEEITAMFASMSDRGN
jgi:octaprenyl-diphosphate synthase